MRHYYDSLRFPFLTDLLFDQLANWDWANTRKEIEEAKKKDTAPQRMLLPGEEDAYENAVADAEREAIRMADRLGSKL